MKLKKKEEEKSTEAQLAKQLLEKVKKNNTSDITYFSFEKQQLQLRLKLEKERLKNKKILNRIKKASTTRAKETQQEYKQQKLKYKSLMRKLKTINIS